MVNCIRKRIISMTVMIIGMVMLLSGCGSGPDITPTKTTVLTFNKENITVGEVYLYMLTIADNYERAYGDAIWSMQLTEADGSKTDMQTVTRKDIIEDIVKVKVLIAQAESLGVTMTADDRSEAEIETESFWKNLTDEQIETMELTRDIVKKCMEENILAGKVYNKVIAGAGVEISDEDARMTTIYDMYFPCFTESDNGTIVRMNDADKKSQYDRAVQAYNTLISPIDEKSDRNVEALAAYYGLTYASYVTKSPTELKETYGKDITDMLYTLEDGSYSLVTETEYGYHIFYMGALTDRAATDKKKERIVRERKNQYFTNRFKDWLRAVDSSYSYERSVNFEVYNSIEF